MPTPLIFDAWVVNVAGEDGFYAGIYLTEEAADLASGAEELRGRERYVDPVRALTLDGGLTGYILDYDEPVPITPS